MDTSRAGKCEQSVRVVSPSGSSVPVNIAEVSMYGYDVTYEPTESGQHRIFLTYNSLELPGKWWCVHRCVAAVGVAVVFVVVVEAWQYCHIFTINNSLKLPGKQRCILGHVGVVVVVVVMVK